MKRIHSTGQLLLAVCCLVLFGASQSVALPFAKSFENPVLSGWSPEGCRSGAIGSALLPSDASWRNLHGNGRSSDEVTRAIAPQTEIAWEAEGATYNPTGPVFDDAGNLYFSPMLPAEDVVLISLDPADGSRRWAIAGSGDAPPGGSAPMVLEDPDHPGEQLIYLALYDRALAVEADGDIVWDVPTGLTLSGDVFSDFVLGLNYIPSIDALALVTLDGFVVLLDRASGAQLQSTPFELPGAPSVDLPASVPQALRDEAELELAHIADFPAGGFDSLLNVLLGEGAEVSNMFSVDPENSRVWLAATSPDAEDGSIDGVSEFGALYRLDVVADGSGFTLSETCRASFNGGTASTPTVSADGSHVYIGDTDGKFLAIDSSDCSEVWEVDLGEQIVGSIAAASDRSELYASTLNYIFKLTDDGDEGTLVWQAAIDQVFVGLTPAQSQFNLNLVAVAANGLYFQAGAGRVLNGTPLPVVVGIGVLDRETGEVRHFVEGAEETVAVMSTAADGALYVGNSPVRAPIAIALGDIDGPVRGGVTKFAPPRSSLVVREAACAAATRLPNATVGIGVCSNAALAEEQAVLSELIAQAQEAGLRAAADESLKGSTLEFVSALLAEAEAGVGAGDASGYADAELALSSVCTALAADVSKTKLLMIDKGDGKAKLVFSSKHKGSAIDKGTASDIEDISAALAFEWNGFSGSFAVPSGSGSGWLASDLQKAKFKNKAAASGLPTAVSSLSVATGKVVKVVAKSTGDVALDMFAAGEPNGAINLRFTTTNDGVERAYCTRFLLGSAQWKETSGGSGRKLLARGGIPLACD